jgi:stage III sporulation protein AF
MRAYIFDWVRTLAAYFIFMTMVLNFIPEGQYRKYVRYFFSLLLLLLLSRPLRELTGWEERMSNSLDEILVGLEYRESLGAGLYVGEEDRHLMERACEEKIREQTEELLAEYGLELVDCASRVELTEEPGVRSIRIRAKKRETETDGMLTGKSKDLKEDEAEESLEYLPGQTGDLVEKIRKRLTEIYELEENQVTVLIQ